MAPSAAPSKPDFVPLPASNRPFANEDLKTQRPDVLQSPFPDLISEDYPDFRASLARDGYVVIKGVIPKDRAISYQCAAYNWLSSFSSDLSFTDPSTWIALNLPLTNTIKSYAQYGLLKIAKST